MDRLLGRAAAFALFLIIPLAGAATPQSAPAGCAVTDLMPAFWSFWDKAKGAEPAEQYRVFEEMVRKPNAAVYEGVFEGSTKPASELVPASFEAVRPVETEMRGLSRKLTDELPGLMAKFRETFPDFRCGTPVYFVYSAGAFDGGTRDVSGKTALMFGLDMIARLKEELPPLVAHELFHVYQEERVGDPSKAFFWSMWTEGLATYVSRRLDPDVPEQKVCCLPPIEPIEAVLPKVSSEALALLDSEKPDEYARFFYGGQKIDIPQRSGYYLGYRAATEAGKTRSLRELAGLTPAEVRPLVEKELRRMASVPKT
jgi:hypothetical protein